MIRAAPTPFLVYGIPPESRFGVELSIRYGFSDVLSKRFWEDERRIRKFTELERRFKNWGHEQTVVAGSRLSTSDLLRFGSQHFERYDIAIAEVEAFVEYVSTLQVLILEVTAPTGEKVLTDLSILLPDRNQIYGSFCQWNPAFRNRSPGLYACLLACHWAAKNGYRYYNMGPVEGFEYKNLFVTDYEPIFGLALTSPEDPLALDFTSPLHCDFGPAQWNRLYRFGTPDARRVVGLG